MRTLCNLCMMRCVRGHWLKLYRTLHFWEHERRQLAYMCSHENQRIKYSKSLIGSDHDLSSCQAVAGYCSDRIWDLTSLTNDRTALRAWAEHPPSTYSNTVAAADCIVETAAWQRWWDACANRMRRLRGEDAVIRISDKLTAHTLCKLQTTFIRQLILDFSAIQHSWARHLLTECLPECLSVTLVSHA